MEGIFIDNDDFQPCWQYYQCSKESMRRCPAFNMGYTCEHFSDCWFFIKNPMQGGPENHGPCMDCEWNHTHGFFKDQE